MFLGWHIMAYLGGKPSYITAGHACLQQSQWADWQNNLVSSAQVLMHNVSVLLQLVVWTSGFQSCATNPHRSIAFHFKQILSFLMNPIISEYFI